MLVLPEADGSRVAAGDLLTEFGKAIVVRVGPLERDPHHVVVDDRAAQRPELLRAIGHARRLHLTDQVGSRIKVLEQVVTAAGGGRSEQIPILIQQFDQSRIHGRFVGVIQAVSVNVDKDGPGDAGLVEQVDRDGRCVGDALVVVEWPVPQGSTMASSRNPTATCR